MARKLPWGYHVTLLVLSIATVTICTAEQGSIATQLHHDGSIVTDIGDGTGEEGGSIGCGCGGMGRGDDRTSGHSSDIECLKDSKPQCTSTTTPPSNNQHVVVDDTHDSQDSLDSAQSQGQQQLPTSRGDPLAGMVLIKPPDGGFDMGYSGKGVYIKDGEGPRRRVALSPYYIDETEVSVEAFARFIEATGYKTDAEEFGWSFVFSPEPDEETDEDAIHPAGAEWWKKVDGALWSHPFGLSGPAASSSDPVVHVSHRDATTYCQWRQTRLPTEAEWEFAARAGKEHRMYPWGNRYIHDRMNIWQGEFPVNNTEEDGYYLYAPVKSMWRSPFGLYHMCGNVWEWVADWFTVLHELPSTPDVPLSNPTGPRDGTQRVIRGGSYLCHHSYCHRYRTSSRSQSTPDSSTQNTGFRCARSADK